MKSSHFYIVLALIVVCRAAQSSEPTFPIELWNVSQRACDNILRTDNPVEGFHSTVQSPVTNMHLSIWKLIPLLMKEEILEREEKV